MFMTLLFSCRRRCFATGDALRPPMKVADAEVDFGTVAATRLPPRREFPPRVAFALARDFTSHALLEIERAGWPVAAAIAYRC